METNWTPQLIEEFKKILPPHLDLNFLEITQRFKTEFDSLVEVEFVKLLNKYHLPYIKYPRFIVDFNGFHSGRGQRRAYTPDFYLPETKMIIEVYAHRITTNRKRKSSLMTLLFPNSDQYLNPNHLFISKRLINRLLNGEKLDYICKKLGIKEV